MGRIKLTSDDYEALSSEVRDPAVGGFTINPRTRRRPRSGFMVSVPGHEVVHPLPDVTPEVIESYTTSRRAVFEEGRRHLGGWANKGKGYLDASIRHPDNVEGEVAARRAAVANHQIAYFNLKTYESPTNPFHPDNHGPEFAPPRGDAGQVETWAAMARIRPAKTRPMSGQEGQSFS